MDEQEQCRHGGQVILFSRVSASLTWHPISQSNIINGDNDGDFLRRIADAREEARADDIWFVSEKSPRKTASARTDTFRPPEPCTTR